MSSTYFFVAACKSDEGAPDSVKAPVIVSPDFATLAAIAFVTVVEKSASFPRACASSFKVSKVDGAEAIKLEIPVLTALSA